MAADKRKGRYSASESSNEFALLPRTLPASGPGRPRHPRYARRGAFRFTVGELLLVMLVLAVVAAAGGYLARAAAQGSDQRGGVSPQLVFILLSLAAPLLVMVVLSVGRLVARLWRSQMGQPDCDEKDGSR